MMLKRMVLSFLMAVLVVAGSGSAVAQVAASTSADEQALRELIQQENQGKDVIKYTDDSIFVSGAFPRPIIGRQQSEAAQPRREEIATHRPNQSTKREVQRLVVSQSGDMAYEFGDFTISFDAPDKNRTSFNGSYLRVWRKINGEWKVDAFFARPNEPSS